MAELKQAGPEAPQAVEPPCDGCLRQPPAVHRNDPASDQRGGDHLHRGLYAFPLHEVKEPSQVVTIGLGGVRAVALLSLQIQHEIPDERLHKHGSSAHTFRCVLPASKTNNARSGSRNASVSWPSVKVVMRREVMWRLRALPPSHSARFRVSGCVHPTRLIDTLSVSISRIGR